MGSLQLAADILRRCGTIGGSRVVAVVAALALGTTAVGLATSRARAEPGCSVETLQGAYALHGTGVAFGGPWAGTGRFTFDGAGHSRGTMIESYSGAIDDGVLEGTYSVEPDCRGTATYTMVHTTRTAGQVHKYRHEVHRVEVVAAAGGAKIFWILVDSYPHAAPPGPHTDDPTISVSGYFERM